MKWVMFNKFSSLPDELHHEICAYLPFPSMLHLAKTTTRQYALWRPLLQNKRKWFHSIDHDRRISHAERRDLHELLRGAMDQDIQINDTLLQQYQIAETKSTRIHGLHLQLLTLICANAARRKSHVGMALDIGGLYWVAMRAKHKHDPLSTDIALYQFRHVNAPLLALVSCHDDVIFRPHPGILTERMHATLLSFCHAEASDVCRICNDPGAWIVWSTLCENCKTDYLSDAKLKALILWRAARQRKRTETTEPARQRVKFSTHMTVIASI